MKKLAAALLILVCSGCSEDKRSEKMHSGSAASSSEELIQTAEPFVVLELFTSEGCSDCPAAEAILNEIAVEAWADRSYVYALSFHVDYWNKLGWKDVFSQSKFSDRQRSYRKVFGNEVVYTPQMVVNGGSEFVGSDREKVEENIKAALSQTPEIYFTITPNETWSSVTIDPVNVQGSAEANAEEYEIHLCVVERGLETYIQRGENEGKTLKHENIVRYMKTESWSNETATHALDFDHELNEKFSLICFVQHRATSAIVGANVWNF